MPSTNYRLAQCAGYLRSVLSAARAAVARRVVVLKIKVTPFSHVRNYLRKVA